MQELYESYYTKSIIEFLHALCSLTVAAVLVALASRLDPTSAKTLLLAIWLVVFISLVWSFFQFVTALQLKHLLRQVLEIHDKGSLFVPKRFKVAVTFLLINTLNLWVRLPIKWPSQQIADVVGVLETPIDIAVIIGSVVFLFSLGEKLPSEQLNEPPKSVTLNLATAIKLGLFFGSQFLIIIFRFFGPKTEFIDQNWATGFFAATMLILAGQLFVSLYKKPTQFRVKLYN